MIIVCTPHFFCQSVTPQVGSVEEMMCVTMWLVTVLMNVNHTGRVMCHCKQMVSSRPLSLILYIICSFQIINFFFSIEMLHEYMEAIINISINCLNAYVFFVRYTPFSKPLGLEFVNWNLNLKNTFLHSQTYHRSMV